MTVSTGRKRPSNIFDPASKRAHKISRSKIDLFLECPRCFYLEVRLGVKRPSLPGFTLNLAVDHLLKKEFDLYREQQKRHPLMEQYDIDAVPYQHPDLSKWRENFVGIQYHHKPTNFLVFGAVDDIWVNPKKELHVVDYKATSKREKPTLDSRWGDQYKRQLEVYRWLLQQNGFAVSEVGYFVYVNGKKDVEAFNGRLEFDIDVIPHTMKEGWIEKTLLDARKLLEDERIPKPGTLCEHCPYRERAGKNLAAQYQLEKKKRMDRLAKSKSTTSLF